MSWLVTLAGSTRQLITFEGSTHVVMVPEELEELEADLATVTAERDELLQDKARLDAMQAMGGRWEATHGIWGKHSGRVFLSNSVSDGALTVREAIDKWVGGQP